MLAPVLKWLVSLRAPTREADWETLYRPELPRIYKFFYYRIGEDVLAEDLTAITFELFRPLFPTHDFQKHPRLCSLAVPQAESLNPPKISPDDEFQPPGF